MQSLLDIIDKSIANAHHRKTTGLEPIDYINTELSIYNYFRIVIVKDMLEKEKEQIINAYEDGKENQRESITNIYKYIIGEYYYNQTYNQNK